MMDKTDSQLLQAMQEGASLTSKHRRCVYVGRSTKLESSQKSMGNHGIAC